MFYQEEYPAESRARRYRDIYTLYRYLFYERGMSAMDTLRRRAGVIGFRAGMLCYLLENRKFTKTVAQFAEWVAEYVFRNQMELWGESIEQLFNGDAALNCERGTATSLLELLPNEFTTGDLIKLRARKGQSVKSSAIAVLLHRWKNNNRIEKTADGRWRKL